MNKLKVLKERFLLRLTIIIAAMLIIAPLVNAAPTVSIYGYTDKTEYQPGSTGTLSFWVYNEGPDDIVLKNITIEYPWYGPLWGGNKTIAAIDVALSSGKNWSSTDSFTIPTDGRATSGYIDITVVYTFGTSTITRTQSIYLSVISSSAYTLFNDMDKIVTLFTVLVVLIIVCTIIIAATVFLSARRPQVTWAKEPKAE